MVNKNFKKATSCLIAGVVGATLMGSNNVLVLADTNLVQTGAGTGSETQVPIQAKQRVSVHDPSIVKDTVNNEYYVFGSHIEAAKSSDLKNWTSFANGYAKTDNVIFGDLATNLAGSFAWAGENDSDSKGGFSVWAPSVIWNPTYVNKDGTTGAYMMYYCTSSTYKRSAIGYAVSKTIEGPYTYVDTIMYSGFTNTGSPVYDANSTINTEVSTLNGKIPTAVNSKWFNSDGSYNTSYAPNAIDPELFYDNNGKLWMNYGSWSGGIYTLEINQTTGQPIYPGVDANTDSVNYTDRFFGKHIAGGFTQSGEGSEIVYDEANGCYYLYMSYAGLAAQGGYNIRMFKSDSPTGPFLDAKGQNAAWGSTANNIDYGIKLIGNYKFNCLDVGYRAAGHNSSFIDSDGKMYLVYHQRFDDGTENHQVRVHQMFINEEGWPVVAPYENSGDEISATGYSTDDIAGDYQFINHGTSNSATMLDTLNVKLTSDGKITGDVTGTWIEGNSNYYMTAVIDGVTYKGVFFNQQDESKYVNKVMTFSAVGTNNEVIWGSKLALSDSEALNYEGNVLDGKIPSNTKTDLTLPTTGAYDTTISWSSTNPTVISTDGKVNRPTGSDETVTLTAKITKGTASITKTYNVLVKGILNFTGVPIYKYNFSTVSGASITNSGSKGTNSGANATLSGSTSKIVDDSDRGKVLEVKNTSGAMNANYLSLPNNSFNGITENGFTVGMWVNIDTTDPNYFEHSALFEADKDVKNFPMTRIGANLIARINAGNGAYSDTDKVSLTSNTWHYLNYTVGTTGIVVYLDGVEVSRQDKDITSSLSGNILATINDVRVGSGSIWNDRDIASAKFDNIALYGKALTDQEVESLYNKELTGDTDSTVTDEQAVNFAANDLTSSIPSSTDKGLTLPATGAYDANISWASSDAGILANDGTVTRPKNIDKEVTLTATITKGSAKITKEFKVTVLGVLTNINVEPTYKYEFNTDSSSDISNSGSATGNAALKGTASIITDADRGNVLQIKNIGGTKANYLALPSTTFSSITDKGYTVSMWANVDESDPNYFENGALFEANGGGQGAYPMTRIGANLFARINASTGWIDTGATGLPSNTWKYVTYTVDPTGISVYVDGKQVNRSNKDISASFQNNVLAGMTDVRVGSGNIFGDSDLASAKFDNVAVYNTALTAQQVEALYNKESGSSTPEIAVINSVVTTPASVTLTPGETKQLTATVDAVGGAAKTVTWSSNDSNNKVTVDQNGLVSVASDSTIGDYEITAISTEDSSKSGKTNVKVVSSSEDEDNTDLKITKQPIGLTIRKGRTATLSVVASGTSSLSYQWRKNEINLIDIDRISGTNEATITIDNVVKSDAGNYDCIITDGIGNVTTSSAAKLTVKSNSSSSSSSSSSSNSSSSSSSSNSSSSNSNNVVDTVAVNNDNESIQNAIKTSGIKTIIINLTDPIQPSDTNQIPVLSQDILIDLITNLDKKLVIKTIDSTIEIKGKDGQIEFTQNGIAITGFKLIGTSEYYLDPKGIMQIGWVQTPDSTWYYLDKATGVKKLHWIQETNGTWYYLDRVSGAMKTGWIKDNEKWYYLFSNGSLATSTNIDGYAVNENGEWVN